ncbi:50S ribosomal protein L24 [Thiotrichales bacterium 19S3-7]|nr:50S ribosomal protein L24 [Thiotrichales bacterium 19S3-7]MCF6801048.1 50S ribosomal protein L24 [Thiotrichales bacterium 19S3-11]
MSKIKSGDQVIVIAGKNKGSRGTVLRSIPEKSRVVVEGVNMIKKHVKPNPQRNVDGGIVEKEASIHVSNVALINPTTDKADRVGIKTLEDGKRVRFFKSNGEVVDI